MSDTYNKPGRVIVCASLNNHEEMPHLFRAVGAEMTAITDEMESILEERQR